MSQLFTTCGKNYSLPPRIQQCNDFYKKKLIKIPYNYYIDWRCRPWFKLSYKSPAKM